MAAKQIKSVAIVAMGDSHREYTSACAFKGDRKKLVQETWAINAMGGIIDHDRMFMMDPPQVLRKVGIRYDRWLKKLKGPIYTSDITEKHKFPGLRMYPLKQVLDAIQYPYLTTTIAAALAYALCLRIPEIHLYGCDFNYPDKSAVESGRGCVEFLLGIAYASGVQIRVANSSMLMDTCIPVEDRMYGYNELYKTMMEIHEDGYRIDLVPR